MKRIRTTLIRILAGILALSVVGLAALYLTSVARYNQPFSDAFPTENILHEKRSQDPSPGVTIAYGNYLARVTDCDRCHGTDLAGGPSPLPVSLPRPNITPGGTITFWTLEEFLPSCSLGSRHMDAR